MSAHPRDEIGDLIHHPPVYARNRRTSVSPGMGQPGQAERRESSGLPPIEIGGSHEVCRKA
jgi:hypothetical protein